MINSSQKALLRSHARLAAGRKWKHCMIGSSVYKSLNLASLAVSPFPTSCLENILTKFKAKLGGRESQNVVLLHHALKSKGFTSALLVICHHSGNRLTSSNRSVTVTLPYQQKPRLQTGALPEPYRRSIWRLTCDKTGAIPELYRSMYYN